MLVGCPVFTEAIKRAVNRKKISMEDIIARKLDAKNAKKRKRDAAKALSKAPYIQMPILAGPSFVSPPPLDTVSISTMVTIVFLALCPLPPIDPPLLLYLVNAIHSNLSQFILKNFKFQKKIQADSGGQRHRS